MSLIICENFKLIALKLGLAETMKRNKFLLNKESCAGLNFIAFNLKVLQIIGDIIVLNI